MARIGRGPNSRDGPATSVHVIRLRDRSLWTPEHSFRRLISFLSSPSSISPSPQTPPSSPIPPILPLTHQHPGTLRTSSTSIPPSLTPTPSDTCPGRLNRPDLLRWKAHPDRRHIQTEGTLRSLGTFSLNYDPVAPPYVRIYVQYNFFFVSTTAVRLGKITEMLHCGTTRVVSSLSPSVPACSPPTAYLSFDSPSSFPYLQCVAALAACVRHVAPSVRQPPTAWFTIAPSRPHARTVLCPTRPMSLRTHRVVTHSCSHLAHAKCCRPLAQSPRPRKVLSPTRSISPCTHSVVAHPLCHLLAPVPQCLWLVPRSL